jgi:hypothetical protein
MWLSGSWLYEELQIAKNVSQKFAILDIIVVISGMTTVMDKVVYTFKLDCPTVYLESLQPVETFLNFLSILPSKIVQPLHFPVFLTGQDLSDDE